MEEFVGYRAKDGYVYESKEECLRHEEDLEKQLSFDIDAEIEITARLSIGLGDIELSREEIPTNKDELHDWILNRIERDGSDLINLDSWIYKVYNEEPNVKMKISSYKCEIFDERCGVVSSTSYKAD